MGVLNGNAKGVCVCVGEGGGGGKEWSASKI